jgi:hypothetical protein
MTKLSNFTPGKGSFGDIASLVARARKPRDPRDEYAYLADSRSQFVKQYRANSSPWPGGIGAWHRPEDWDDEGNLLATGRAAAMALDPWANARREGFLVDNVTGQRKPVPPLRFEGIDPVDAVTPVTRKRANVTPKNADVTPKPADVTRKRTAAERQRDSRAAKKLGLSVAEYRAKLALE